MVSGCKSRRIYYTNAVSSKFAKSLLDLAGYNRYFARLGCGNLPGFGDAKFISPVNNLGGHSGGLMAGLSAFC